MTTWGVIAALGHLAWLAGNVREARTGAIERWATHPPAAVFARGRPPRYYLLLVPPTLAATITALVHTRGRDRPAVVAAAASSATAVAITVLLVRSVNLPLFRGESDPTRRELLIRRWHRLNRVRVAVLAATIGGLLRTSAAAMKPASS